jgi:hypothetical protein
MKKDFKKVVKQAKKAEKKVLVKDIAEFAVLAKGKKMLYVKVWNRKCSAAYMANMQLSKIVGLIGKKQVYRFE